MKKACFLLLLLIGISHILYSQSTPIPPKVIIGISIDGLNHNYLTFFKNELSAKGFKRLMQESTCLENVDYGYQSAGMAADIATLYTGSLPYVHGIAGNTLFNRNAAKSSSICLDATAHSFGLSPAYSAHRLQASTLTDQLDEASMGKSNIVSIAIDPTAATLQAGHTGLALWMDPETGRWNTSSYYQTALPSWAGKTADDYLANRWEPLGIPALYHAISTSKTKTFAYDLAQFCYGKNKYKQFATTPYANSMVADLAMQAIQNYGIGKDIWPDMLLLQFSLQPLYTQTSAPMSIELEDAYLRLDKELGAFLDFLDKHFGKDQVLVYLTGTRQTAYKQPNNPRIPSKSFCTYRYMALLNAYLMAHYGKHNWVLGAEDGNIYLNRKLIEEQNKDLRQVQQTAINFLSTIPGIMNVSSSFQLNAAFIGAQQLRYAFHANSSGDILFSLLPGWYEVDKNDKPTGFYSPYNTTTCLYLWGWKMPATKVTDNIPATAFAPSMARFLRIAPPNAAQGDHLPIDLTE